MHGEWWAAYAVCPDLPCAGAYTCFVPATLAGPSAVPPKSFPITAANSARKRYQQRLTKMGQLSHIRVLDLSRVLAGPWAGQILADLGADVIKVERPGAGDDTRGWGPPFLRDQSGAETGEAGYFLAVNRGKRSVTVSLDKPEGQAIIRELAARSDIVLENFKAGTLARYHLAYEDLKAVNPEIIYCSASGFGQNGQGRDQRTCGGLLRTRGGLMGVTGARDGKPGGG